MPHLESKTKLIMTASINKYIKPKKINSFTCVYELFFVLLQRI